MAKRTAKARLFRCSEILLLLPDTLLAARDLGKVVFLCGAGISLPTGLPDFGRLVDTLLDGLTAENSRRSREEGQSLDYVFKEMVKEFG